MPIEQNKMILQQLLTKNQITLKNLWDLNQNFGTLFDQESTICYENCQDMRISINSKINRIIFKNCKNMDIKLSGLISGIEIKNCTNIEIDNKKKLPLNSLIMENSKFVKMTVSKRSHKETYYEITKSNGILITDHSNNSLLLR